MNKQTRLIALLSLAVPLGAVADVQLTPAGEFVGRDGRPGKNLTWKLSDAQGAALAAKLTARHTGVQFNLDYEHQAMLAEKNGQPAPASGWAARFEWRAGLGLFALNVQWTARAKAAIEAAEYKYISPVIVYDKTTGEVLDVLNASLVNIPNLEMNAVAQERVAALNLIFNDSLTETENAMNPVLLALLKALGLPETDATTAEQATAAVATLKTARDAATTEVATLKAASAGSGEPDPAKYVPIAALNAVSAEVALLKTAQAGRDVDGLIEAARGEGRVYTPELEAAWRNAGKADIAQLKALIAATPANPVLAGLKQTTGMNLGKRDPNAAASAEELAMAKNMGMTLAEFRGEKAAA